MNSRPHRRGARHGLRVAAHAIGTRGIKNALRAGIDSIEHGHLLDDEAIALFRARDVSRADALRRACISRRGPTRRAGHVVGKARELEDMPRQTRARVQAA